MSRYFLYDVYCIEEATTRRVVSFIEPTKCPIKHNDRTIDQTQTTMVGYVEQNPFKFQTLVLNNNYITKNKYSDIKAYFYYDKDYITSLTTVYIVGHMSKKAKSFSVKVYDATNRLVLGEGEFTNTDEIDIIKISDLATPPSDALIEFHAKVDSGSAYIKGITLYYY